MSDCEEEVGVGGEHGCCESPDLGECEGFSATDSPSAADSPAEPYQPPPPPPPPSSLLTTSLHSPASPPSPSPLHQDSSSPSPSPHDSVARHVPSRSVGLLRRSTRSPPPLSLAHHHLHHHHHHSHHHHLHHSHSATDSDDPDDPDLQPQHPQQSSSSLVLSDTEAEGELSPSAHVHYKDEPLSVSVVPEDSPLDTHDSGLLSPAEISPREQGSVNVASMIDASDFRSIQPEPIYQNLSSMNGRMSPPGFSPSSASSYATLTPLQPLPPISTVSDKFAYGHSGNVSGSFTVMQNNGLGNMLSMGSPYQYDKLSMSPPHYASNNGLGISLGHQHSPLSPHSYQNGLASPQKSLSPNGYDSPYTRQDMSRTTLSAATHSPTLSPPVSLHHSPTQQPFSSFTVAPTPTLTTSALNMNGLGSLSPQNVSPHSPNYSPQLHGGPPSPPNIKQEPHLHGGTIGCQLVNMSAPMSMPINQSPPHAHMAVTMPQQISGIQTPISAIPTSCGAPMKPSPMATTSGGGSMGGVGGGEVEEINTKELAQRISAELKRYSIPQAIFAQRVLCRSQGTLSDLLRNPKPWSKLKSGRETFRRMWKWLQEPEFQRMSALRLAGQSS
ncbi:UNVERIFIED_CONTAM: hypothetical protein GTU68_049929 [Idotea baltica]|nr:hypothetical protein [Idotea baltica]